MPSFGMRLIMWLLKDIGKKGRWNEEIESLLYFVYVVTVN